MSRSRANSINKNTLEVFPDYIEVLVPESEKDLYQSMIPNPILTVPDEIEGLGRLRNWVLENFKEEIIVMVDDDINKLYCLTGPLSRPIRDKDEVIQIIINTAVMARDLGTNVFGFAQTDIRKFKSTEPFLMSTWVGCVIGVIGRRFKFRNDKYKVDIDYCLQNLLVNRVLWVDSRYWFSQSRDNNMGGNAKFRNELDFEKSVRTLQDKWGECLNISSFKSNVKIRMNVKRKQAIQYE